MAGDQLQPVIGQVGFKPALLIHRPMRGRSLLEPISARDENAVFPWRRQAGEMVGHTGLREQAKDAIVCAKPALCEYAHVRRIRQCGVNKRRDPFAAAVQQVPE
jgi:hypothetical protein